MSISVTELEDFHQFAQAKLNNGGAESLEELCDLWRVAHPTPEETADVREAIRQGLEDIQAGRYRPAAEVTAELRAKYGIRQ